MADGEPLAEPIPVATGLAFPEGLAVAPDGSLLVVETGAGRLSRIDTTTGEVSPVAEGLELGAQGVEGMPPTWMFNGVAVGPSGAIYVTGDVANVVYRLEAPGLPTTGGTPAGTMALWFGVAGALILALGIGLRWAWSRSRISSYQKSGCDRSKVRRILEVRRTWPDQLVSVGPISMPQAGHGPACATGHGPIASQIWIY